MRRPDGVMATSVTLVRDAAHVAAGLHAVQHPGQRRLLHDGHAGQLADAHGLGALQRRQHPPLGDGEALGRHHPVELAGDQVAGLRQQRRQVVVDEAARLLVGLVHGFALWTHRRLPACAHAYVLAMVDSRIYEK
jgi:hypothetical protein